jgi:hypothetical protein
MPVGRPTKRTPEITARIAYAIAIGLTNEEAAALVGIDDTTLFRWQAKEDFCEAIASAKASRKLLRLQRIENGEQGWQSAAWALERQDPMRFGRPEVQLSINQTNNSLALGSSCEQAILERLKLYGPQTRANG